jgi:hypothetical protein
VVQTIDFIKRILYIPLLLLLIGFLFAPKAHAALGDVSDTLTTSRPSAAAPLVSAQLGGGVTGQVIVVDNGSMFLASDSAVLQSDTGQIQDILTVASMSAQQAGPPVQRNIYFTTSIPDAHHAGTTLVSNITATHMIDFTPGIAIPNGGKIVITFPGSGSNIASPSATGFSFNNLQASQIICNPTTACAGGISITGNNTITLTTSAVQSAPIYVAIGCTGTITVSGGVGTCTAYKSALINPTISSNTACTAGALICAADIWRLQIQTQDATGIALDTSRIAIGTINSVQVYATVEPTLTFSIAGVTQATNWGSLAASCGNEAINTGFDTSATTVNLGSLNNGNFSKTAQLLTISTNGSYGYALTSTSSGHLINPAAGIWLPDANGGNGLTANDVPAPAGIKIGTNASGSAYFGISPCGSDVAAMWGGANHISINSNFSNPWNNGSGTSLGNVATLASYTGGYVNGDATHGTTVVRYVASIAGSTPAGLYTTVFTYVATASF